MIECFLTECGVTVLRRSTQEKETSSPKVSKETSSAKEEDRTSSASSSVSSSGRKRSLGDVSPPVTGYFSCMLYLILL